ncbi:MAG: Ni/Fe hydrogenase subunit alpha [Gammaproteobacteria bacterium]|nr:Ni/Fe hydrogenase subunit alpha [Gammaproteobacteria bacterium]MBU1730753.1 Ni/Fe hydrogenase subunit alpha [Gammaproteobacteria bacterium]MBU1891299.1 Ni/Fe hydrogenase subunit alpha [Gammaproteobacteria bacterium]
MTFELETADHPENLKRVVIEPVTRVEGHGKVTLLLDEDNRIHQARFHIVEFRGFEKFIQGRPYTEVPVLVQRLCGICPVSHHLAASKAMDMIIGATLTPSADKLRRLMHFGQILQSHALHFFYLASPDLLFGFDSDPATRNIVGVAAAYPEIARQGVALRKYGQEVIRLTAGKRIHGTGAIPGGVNKNLSVAERDFLLKDIEQIIAWSQGAVDLIRKVYCERPEFHNGFGYFRSSFMSLVRPDGALDFYHGGLRARDEHGQDIFDHLDYSNYWDYVHEEVKPWSYMKFPFIRSRGREEGWYRVGPLARVNNCDFIPTPLAEAERRVFTEFDGGSATQATLAFHWTRMIEMLHCAEGIQELLHDDDLLGDDLISKGERALRGVGVIEAPRGTLIHHYRINEDEQIVRANLIVSTTHNNQAMNEAVRQVALQYLDGNSLTEGLLNHIEVAIRAFDPCLSCATHAVGKMPLEVELIDAEGKEIDRMVRNASGACGV